MQTARILPHPNMTAAQLEQLCRDRGLVKAHIGGGRLALLQGSSPAAALIIRFRFPRPVILDFSPEIA